LSSDGEIYWRQGHLIENGKWPFIYQWSDPNIITETETSYSGFSQGSYFLTITDDNECSGIINLDISGPNGPTIFNEEIIHTCNGLNNGSISIFSYPFDNFQFNWNNGMNGHTISGLLSGLYEVTVTDPVTNCVTIDEFEVQSIPNVPITGIQVDYDKYICEISGNYINLEIFGGSPPFNCLLDDIEFSKNSHSFRMLKPSRGTHTLEVSDLCGNSYVHNFEMFVCEYDVHGETTNYESSLNLGSIDLDVDHFCQEPITFEWNNGETTEDIQDLQPGYYYVVITDANGCSISKSFEIIDCSGNSSNFNFSIIDYDQTECENGDQENGLITFEIYNNSKFYEYILIFEDTDIIRSGETNQSHLTFDLLSEGNYDLKILQHNSCDYIDLYDFKITCDNDRTLCAEPNENISGYACNEVRIILGCDTDGDDLFDGVYEYLQFGVNDECSDTPNFFLHLLNNTSDCGQQDSEQIIKWLDIGETTFLKRNADGSLFSPNNGILEYSPESGDFIDPITGFTTLNMKMISPKTGCVLYFCIAAGEREEECAPILDLIQDLSSDFPPDLYGLKLDIGSTQAEFCGAIQQDFASNEGAYRFQPFDSTDPCNGGGILIRCDGQKITIPAGNFIELDNYGYDQASLFDCDNDLDGGLCVFYGLDPNTYPITLAGEYCPGFDIEVNIKIESCNCDNPIAIKNPAYDGNCKYDIYCPGEMSVPCATDEVIIETCAVEIDAINNICAVMATCYGDDYCESFLLHAALSCDEALALTNDIICPSEENPNPVNLPSPEGHPLVFCAPEEYEVDGFNSKDCPESLSSIGDPNNDFIQMAFHSGLVNGSNTPAVVLGPITNNDQDIVIPVIKNLNNSGYKLGIKELDYQDGVHNIEKVSHFSADPGIYDLGGIKMISGKVDDVNHNYQWVYFDEAFQSPPIVLAMQTSQNDNTPSVARVHSVQANRFRVKIQEADSQDDLHDFEAISYMAFEQGSGMIDGKKIHVGATTRSVNHNWYSIDFPTSLGQNGNDPMFDKAPIFFASMQSAYGPELAVVRFKDLTNTNVQLKLQEDQSLDTETNHTTQIIGYVLMENQKDCDCIGRIESINLNILNEPNCEMNNGLAWLSVTGGVPPLYYNLGDGPLLLDPFNDNIMEDLSSGDFQITVSDSNGCEFIDSINISSAGLDLNNVIFSNQNCSGNLFNVELLPDSGNPPYSYNWSNGNSSNQIIDVSSGVYDVTVTDESGCEGIKSFDLRNPYLTFTKTHSQCGLDNGKIEAKPKGISPFTYLWNTGESTREIQNLSPGLYTVTVSDAAGCTNSRVAYISEDVQFSTTVEDPFCEVSNGAIKVIASGLPPYTYNWSTGATTQNITNLPSGDYSLTVTDAGGCSGILTRTLENHNEINVSTSGGNEGFYDGKFIPAGLTINWFFDAKKVADQLIISSDIDGDIINTGAVTNHGISCCDASFSCCSNFFLADHINQNLTLLEGVGVPQQASSGNCNGNPKAKGLSGSFTTVSDSYITIEVIGSVCGGSTAWNLSLSCSGITNTVFEDDNLEDIEILESTTSIDKSEVDNNLIKIFPNPTMSDINIISTDKAISIHQIKIYDITNRLILVKNNLNDNRVNVNINELNSGILIFEVTRSNNKKSLHRIIKI